MADFGNSSVFSQTDANNNSATQPGIKGSDAPSRVDDTIRALQGASTRQWAWTNPTITTTGTGTAYVATYAVAPAALYTGQTFWLIAHTASTGAATLNVAPHGATAIKKVVAGSLVDVGAGDIAAASVFSVYYNGTFFVLLDIPYALPTASATEVLTGTDTAKAVTADANAALWEQGPDVASASTISLSEGGYFNITGTTTIVDIDFVPDKSGRRAWLKFAGALTLTHSGTTLILPGGANITTAAGDIAEFVSEGSDVVRCVAYTRATGKPLINPDALSTASGTAPSYSVRAWVNFDGATATIRASGNVTSVTRNAAGDYTINFTTAMPDANYSVSITSRRDGSPDTNWSATLHPTTTPPTTTTSVRIAMGVASSGVFSDSNYITVMVLR